VAPPLRTLLQTTPLGLADLAVIGVGALAPLALREGLKTIQYPQGGRRG
jgi:hypothetical protein